MTDDPKPPISPEKALRFKPLVPNRETIEAIKAVERGEVTTVGHPRKLLKSLNADRTRGAKP
jgi:DNA-damage-inducible protein J